MPQPWPNRNAAIASLDESWVGRSDSQHHSARPWEARSLDLLAEATPSNPPKQPWRLLYKCRCSSKAIPLLIPLIPPPSNPFSIVPWVALNLAHYEMIIWKHQTTKTTAPSCPNDSWRFLQRTYHTLHESSLALSTMTIHCVHGTPSHNAQALMLPLIHQFEVSKKQMPYMSQCMIWLQRTDATTLIMFTTSRGLIWLWGGMHRQPRVLQLKCEEMREIILFGSKSSKQHQQIVFICKSIIFLDRLFINNYCMSHLIDCLNILII